MIDLRRRLAITLTFAIAALFAPLAQSTETPLETKAIGAFTLTYDPAQWRVDGGGSTFMAICSADACSHAVVAVTITPTEGWCDTLDAHDAAVAAFPWATNHGSNMHARERYALYFVSSSAGYDPDNRYAAYACITHRGLRYEFVSKLGDGERPGPFHSGSVFELLGGLAAPPAEAFTLEVEDLTFDLTDDVWATGKFGGEDGLWSLTCLPPACEEHAWVPISANPVPLVGTCEAMPPPYEEEFNAPEVTKVGGAVEFELTTYHSLCRAWTPPSQHACAVHNGIRYTVSNGIPDGGCYFGPYVPDATFLDLLEGITVE
jgi:hypothetical protein